MKAAVGLTAWEATEHLILNVGGVLVHISLQSSVCLMKAQVVDGEQLQFGVVMAQAPAAEHQRSRPSTSGSAADAADTCIQANFWKLHAQSKAILPPVTITETLTLTLACSSMFLPGAGHFSSCQQLQWLFMHMSPCTLADAFGNFVQQQCGSFAFWNAQDSSLMKLCKSELCAIKLLDGEPLCMASQYCAKCSREH